MKKVLRVDMVARRCVFVSVDEEKFESGEVDLEEKVRNYINQGNIATDWELEDPDYGIEEVDATPDIEIE